jgi:hypothetical protein
MINRKFKIIVNVPVSHAEAVRLAMGDAGGGCAGNYSHCSFSMRGIGRFKGNPMSNPHIGEAGEYSSAEEERVEVSHIAQEKLRAVIEAMERVHPYEETAYEVIELHDIDVLCPK